MDPTRHYDEPAMAWLKMTDFLHGWLEWEFGGDVVAHGMRVLSIQHLPGAKDILRQEVCEDTMEPGRMGRSMSVTRRNCIEAGMILDADATESLYGVSRNELKLYVPIECPRKCLTKYGVIRPWTWDVTFGRRQASNLTGLLYREFWRAVERFDREYAARQGSHEFTAKEMVTEFCAFTRTSDVHIEEIRREWQRRCKREKERRKS